MNENLKKIHDYLINLGATEEMLKEYDKSSVYLAQEIAEYAHRNQKRENGEEYVNHPMRVLQNYRNLVGIDPDDYFCIDEDLMFKNNVPFNGVQEVCVLHDVVEDTEFTLEDVEKIYEDCGLGIHFKTYIKDALNRITHIKSVCYEDYINICLENPISSIVKMLDLQDNLKIIDLVSFDEENYHRAQRYLSYIYVLNGVHHFLENIQKYRREFEESR